MFIKSIRNGFVDIHIINNFLIDLFDSMVKMYFSILYVFLLVVHRLAEKQFVKLEIFLFSVSKSVRFDVLKKLSREFIIVSKVKEMLNTIKILMIVHHENVLILSLLRNVLQSIERIVSFEITLLFLQLTLDKMLFCLSLVKRLIANKGKQAIAVVVGVTLSEEVYFFVIKESLLLVHIANRLFL